MPEAVLGGIQTHWRVLGEGAAQALALHCSLAHSGAWAGLAKELPGLTITAPDLLGHGRSADWDGRRDFHAEATRQAMALLAQMPAGPVHLIGHSFGATVALRIALQDPDRIASLSLFEPVLFCAARAADPAAYAAHLASHAAFDQAYRAGDMPAAAAAFQAIWGNGQALDSLPPGPRAYIIDRIRLIHAQNAALMDDAGGLLGFGGLEALGLPVLLAQGAMSPPVIEAINTELARRLPQVRRAVVTGAGHMLPITHAADAAALVSEFMAELALA
ncbi:alpha/beta fold hydrolase [Pseudorhodobacter sp. E13]|uniref:alpha/beta fold hydrolase n=1 Tax=Pseudorhodobacter sp. E13 TaxID=2487931 RepID=UPI000F8F7BF4|nr:alpha/beta fold hydrolase [Pseudorhodobacter sp. E13]RUS59842.1 alpha/beta fold hydrolase [Pseudorhodobacter sp. E13]